MQLSLGFKPLVLLFLWNSILGCGGQNKGASNWREAVEEPVPAAANPVNFEQGVFCGLLDSEDVLWFGSNGGGLYRYDSNAFTHFTEENGLCDNQVTSITEDHNGKLLLGTASGVCTYDGTRFTTISIPESDTTGVWLDKVYPVVNPNQVMSIVVEEAGALWIATNGGGAYYYDGEYFTQHLLQEGRRQEDGLHHNIIQDLLKDMAGNIWFPSMIHGGISRYDGEEFTRFMPEDGLAYDMVRRVEQDRAGNIYFGTLHHGFSRYDGTSFTNFTTADGLLSNDVSCIFEASNGQLWLGSGIGQTSIFDGQSFKAFTTSEGRAIENILCILEDTNNNIWLGGRFGLWLFDGTSVKNMTRVENW